MPAPKTVEEAAILVDGWIATLHTMAATDPARAVRNALHKATTLEHMPDGWGFVGPHLIEKLRQTARDIKAAQPTTPNHMLPNAVQHLKTYPIDTLDMTTVRNLRDECESWLKFMDGIRCGMLAQPEALKEWDEVSSEDVKEVEATLSTIAAHITHIFSEV